MIPESVFRLAAQKIFDLDEGVKQQPYKDSQGNWTIGRGHLIGDKIENFVLPLEAVELIFDRDLSTAIREAQFSVGTSFYNSISPARQLALVTMLFTLGRNKWLKFDETMAAIETRNWDAVSAHILNSKWARDVDPEQRPNEGRDDRIAYMFRTGDFHPDYKIT